MGDTSYVIHAKGRRNHTKEKKMNKKMMVFLVLVLVVLAFALFTPHGVSAAGPKQYKVIQGSFGEKSKFEQDVSAELNNGWSLAGGVSFATGNSSIYYNQALVK
jgi:hypothetical protein